MDTKTGTVHRDGRTGGDGPPTHRRLRRAALITAAVLGAVVLLLLALLVGLRLARPGALPGTTVSGIAVGGLQGDALEQAVERAGKQDLTVTVTSGEESASATGAELGYSLDVDATVERVLTRGRQLNPITALGDHLRAFRGGIAVGAVEHLDDDVLSGRVSVLAGELEQPPAEGAVIISGTLIERIDPADGTSVRVEELGQQVRAALIEGGPTTIEAPVDLEPAETTLEAVDAAFAAAERAVSGPITLRREDAALTLSADEIGELLRAEREGGDLRLEVDAGRLDRLVDNDLREALETEPSDARFEVSGDAVSIVESVDGFRFDADIAAEQVLEIATSEGPREAELAGEPASPDLSTAEAEALGITERVSSFTTEYPCCQSRVQNIHRIAELINGVVIKPGETFSVNEFVGPRTREKGFTDGGAIFDGEFITAVGGGVSQFATTMFNAAFFGGYDIPDYKAHSYYISRYPPGREATLNWPDVDLKVRNNSPHGILVQTSVTGTSVTVTFWGTNWVEVSDITGERRNASSPPVRHRDNPDLAAGAERVVQSGRSGFDITVVRILQFPDGREEREEYFTRYLPEPRIIERGTDAPPSNGEEEDGDEDDAPPDNGEGNGESDNGGNGESDDDGDGNGTNGDG